MKHIIFISALLMAGAAGEAMAIGGGTCTTGTQLEQLDTFLQNKTICATSGSDEWQEWHAANGELWDYKLGPLSMVDPTEQVGTWSASGGQQQFVEYDYGTGGRYKYKVYDVGDGTYNFCFVGSGINITGTTFVGGGAGTTSTGPVSCH